jgi:ABC-type thiamine transport system ATPase subunit
MRIDAGKNNKVTVEIIGHSFDCLKKIMRKTRRLDGGKMTHTDAVRYLIVKTAEGMK